MHPDSKQTYYPYIDGLRAIAVLSVIVYHLKPSLLPGGFSGVDVFFVISGFIVSASVGYSEERNFFKFATTFFARRLQRIAPVLIVCLLFTTVFSAFFIPDAWLSYGNQQTGLYAFFGLSNYILAKTNNDYYSPNAEYNPFTHTWSLGVEEQFYIIFPILFFLWPHKGRFRYLAVGILAIATIVSLFAAASQSQINKANAYYLIASRFWELGLGVLLYQFMSLFGRKFDSAEYPTPKWYNIGAAIALALVVCGFIVSKPGTYSFPGAFFPVIGSLGLIGFLHGKSKRNFFIVALSNNPTVFIGKISYSLYLWHWPVFVLFRWTIGLEALFHCVIAVLLTFLLATASYFLVEKPIRRSPKLRMLPRYVVALTGVFVVSCTAFLANKINQLQPSISLSTVSRNSDEWYPFGKTENKKYPGCVITAARSDINTGYYVTYARADCELPVTGPKIFAIGDSHAGAYDALYKEYVLKSGAQVVLYNNGGCPFMSLQNWREDSQSCKQHSQAAWEDILANIHRDDVLFLPSLRLPRFADQWIKFREADILYLIFSGTAVSARQQATIAAVKTLQQLEGKGVHVILEAPKPIFRAPPFRCSDVFNRDNPICEPGLSMKRSELIALRQPVLDSFHTMESEIAGLKIWDPFLVLCPEGTSRCDAVKGGKPLFFDADHVSGYGNQVLFPSFYSMVAGTGAIDNASLSKR